MTDTTPTAAAPDPSTGERRHLVKFHATPGSKPTVQLDEHDITRKLSGIQIVSDPVAGTRVALEVHPKALGDVEFEGVAVVQVNTYSDDPGPAAAVFLGAIDPAILERRALERLDLGVEEAATTAAILRTLIEWANGEGTL